MAPLQAIFNHLVLPPKVPGQAEASLGDIEGDVLARLNEACIDLQSVPGQPGTSHALQILQRSLQSCARIYDGEHLDKTAVIDAFNQLQPHDILILHVVEQNAALLVRRSVR